MWQDLPDDVRSGEALYGNDFTGDQLTQWFAAEQQGFYELDYANQTDAGFDHFAMNALHGRLLGPRRFEVCVAFGCGAGEDIKALRLDLGRIIAIEPATAWWSDRIGDIPASYRMPELSGALDIPDRSVDLVVALGSLHHVANVERVIVEFGRVLKPGGRLMIREPINSMGDFTEPRPGLTRHERGIPKPLMRRFIEAAGLTVTKRQFCSSTIMSKPLGRIGVVAFNSRFWTWLDTRLSALLASNARYWRPRLIDKFAPTSAVYGGLKP